MIRTTLHHFRGTPLHTEITVPALHDRYAAVHLRNGDAYVEVSTDDPVFLEELEGAARKARLALEARTMKVAS